MGWEDSVEVIDGPNEVANVIHEALIRAGFHVKATADWGVWELGYKDVHVAYRPPRSYRAGIILEKYPKCILVQGYDAVETLVATLELSGGKRPDRRNSGRAGQPDARPRTTDKPKEPDGPRPRAPSGRSAA